MSTVRMEEEDLLRLLKERDFSRNRIESLLEHSSDQLQQIRAYKDFLRRQGLNDDDMAKIISDYTARCNA